MAARSKFALVVRAIVSSHYALEALQPAGNPANWLRASWLFNAPYASFTLSCRIVYRFLCRREDKAGSKGLVETNGSAFIYRSPAPFSFIRTEMGTQNLLLPCL
jgi:hypothetical protein